MCLVPLRGQVRGSSRPRSEEGLQESFRTGFLLNEAIFRRDLPVLQGTILVLAMFFVAVNLIVDVMQTSVDPRIKRD